MPRVIYGTTSNNGAGLADYPFTRAKTNPYRSGGGRANERGIRCSLSTLVTERRSALRGYEDVAAAAGAQLASLPVVG